MVFSQPGAVAAGLPAYENAAFVLARPASRLPFYFAAILIFTHFARPFDAVLVGYKIPAIICSICIVVVVLSQGLKDLQSSVGMSCLFLVGWMCVSGPFSSWKGGSFMYVMSYAQFFLPLMLLISVASRTPNDVVKLSGVLAFSCACHLIFNGTEANGRYGLTGTFGNSDDVALLAGFTIPFFVLAAGRLRNPVVRYLLMICGTGYLLSLVGRTATRAAIPALLVMLMVYTFRAKGAQRLGILAFAGIATLFLMMILSASNLERLSTVFDAFSPTQTYADNSEAHASALARHDIMKDAIATTLEHPLVGIGSGMFAQYRWDHITLPDGRRKPYLPTHNTYLEVSSECGIPGLIFYLIFLWTIYRQSRVVRKLIAAQVSSQSELIGSIALCLEAAIVYFVVCAAFMTCDKHPHQFALAGFAIALSKMAPSWLAEAPPVAVPRAPCLTSTIPIVGKRPFPIGAR
jgi:O-antigen ligase